MKCVLLAVVLVLSVLYVNAADLSRRIGLKRPQHNGNRQDNQDNKWIVVDNELECLPGSSRDECQCQPRQRGCFECNRCFCGGGMWMCHLMACPPPGENKRWGLMENINTGRQSCRKVNLV